MTNKNLKDLFIKLKNVFSKDMYVVKGKYCIEGPISKNKNYGYCVAILENKWLDTITEFIEENNLSKECFYISDVDSAKKFANDEEFEFKDIFKDDDNFHTIVDDLIQKLEITDSIAEWTKLSDDSSFVDDVFINKGIYKLDVGDDNAIRIGKPALPLVTEKTIDKLFYNVHFDESYGMYRLVMKYNFTHFQLFMFYSAIPMKK